MSDIFDQADNAVETKPEFSTWGQVAASFYEAIWAKGQPAPERFDASVHSPADKFIRAEIMIIPLDEMNAKFPAEFKGNVTGWNNRDWAAVILPSIKALNLSVRDIADKWVKVTKKPNGKFYEKKKDGVKTGEKAELTDFLFVKLFASQDECLADFLATKAGEPVTQASADAFPVDVPVQAVTAAPAQPGDAILEKFLKAIIDGAAKNSKDLATVTEAVRVQLAGNPMLGKKFNVDMPEVLTLIMAACNG